MIYNTCGWDFNEHHDTFKISAYYFLIDHIIRYSNFTMEKPSRYGLTMWSNLVSKHWDKPELFPLDLIYWEQVYIYNHSLHMSATNV